MVKLEFDNLGKKKTGKTWNFRILKKKTEKTWNLTIKAKKNLELLGKQKTTKKPGILNNFYILRRKNLI